MPVSAKTSRITLDEVKNVMTIRQFFKKARKVAEKYVDDNNSCDTDQSMVELAREVIAYIDTADPEAKE